MTEQMHVTECAHCRKNLALVDEVVAVDGLLYCSEACAIIHLTNENIMNAKAQAIKHYDEAAEIVRTADIGICYEKVWTAYSKEGDLTTILKSKYSDSEMRNVVSTEVVGFYFGEPDDASTTMFTGELKAEYQ